MFLSCNFKTVCNRRKPRTSWSRQKITAKENKSPKSATEFDKTIQGLLSLLSNKNGDGAPQKEEMEGMDSVISTRSSKFQFKSSTQPKSQQNVGVMNELLKIAQSVQVPSHSGISSSVGWVYRNPHSVVNSKRKSLTFPDAPKLADATQGALLDSTPAATTVIPIKEHISIPQLAHGLQRVIRSPGIHPMKDFYTHRPFFPTFLGSIHSPDEFDFNSLPPFVPAHQDKDLHAMAVQLGCNLIGSTSGLTPFLSQLYFLITRSKNVTLNGLSNAVQDRVATFTKLTTGTSSTSLLPKGGGVYAIRNEKVETFRGDPTILLKIGHQLEKMLTLEPEAFEKFLLKNGTRQTPPQDAYHHLKVGNTLMRAQIDCYDPEITSPYKTFDLKTRAIGPIRFDLPNYLRNRESRLVSLTGGGMSFEKEFYDMMRSSLLRYNFQARIGCMNGIFVAYHNTQSMLGFEYLTLEEMDKFLFGSTTFGEKHFNSVLKLKEHLVNFLLATFPNEHLRLTMQLSPHAQYLRVFVEVPFVKGAPLEHRTQQNPIQGDLHAFDMRVDLFLNGDQVVQVLHMEPTDQLSLKVSITEADLSQTALRDGYLSAFLALLDVGS